MNTRIDKAVLRALERAERFTASHPLVKDWSNDAEDQYGCYVAENSKQARCWCITGGFWKVNGTAPGHNGLALEVLCLAAGNHRFTKRWTRPQIAELYKRARRLAAKMVID